MNNRPRICRRKKFCRRITLKAYRKVLRQFVLPLCNEIVNAEEYEGGFFTRYGHGISLLDDIRHYIVDGKPTASCHTAEFPWIEVQKRLDKFMGNRKIF